MLGHRWRIRRGSSFDSLEPAHTLCPGILDKHISSITIAFCYTNSTDLGYTEELYDVLLDALDGLKSSSAKSLAVTVEATSAP